MTTGPREPRQLVLGPGPDPRLPLDGRFPPSLPALFARRVAHAPDALALSDSYGRWSYLDVDRISSRIAKGLESSGIGQECVVAVWAHRSAGLPVALLATLKARAAFAILDASHPVARLRACVQAVRPRALVQLEAARPVPPEVESELLAQGCWPRFVLPAEPTTVGPLADWSENLPSRAAQASDLAYVSFTSGTTGRPKAVMGEHGPLSHFIEWHREHASFTAADRFAMLSGLAHDPLLRDVFTPLCCGASLWIPEPEFLRQPEALLAWAWESEVTAAHLTPSLGQFLVHASRQEGSRLPALRHVFFAGEPLPYALASRFRALAPQVRCVNFYGATETPQAMGFHVVEPCELDRQGWVPIGVGIDGVQLLVLSGDMQPVRPGEEGEVWVRTPYLTRGYLGDSALTRARFVANPFTLDPSDRLYRTGDRGRMSNSGPVEYAGRADRQVKLRGFRFELGEVEAVLSSHPAVATAIVALREFAPGEPKLVAWLSTVEAIQAQTLRAFVADYLPEYQVPQVVVLLDRLPLTPNGKVDHAALPLPTHFARNLSAPYADPRTDVERNLAALWADVLHVDRVGVDDSFFELGGHSLVALELVERMERTFRRRLPLKTFLDRDTVAKMAVELTAPPSAAATSPLVTLNGTGSRRPIFWLPGGGGLSVMAFRAISRRLGVDQPVYGCEADTDLTRAPRDLQGLATYYIDEIRKIRPCGPYHLFGFSLGSFLAWEMAVQLARQREPAGLLLVFDTEVPTALSLPYKAVALIQRTTYTLLRRHVSLRRLSSHLLHRLRRPLYTNPSIQSDHFARVIETNRHATFCYARQPLPHYPGSVTAVLALDVSSAGITEPFDARLGWGLSAAGGVNVLRVPGDHLTMLEPPHVDTLASALRSCLDAFSKSDESPL